jgi:outer membrane lipopolysaccharide assembly protein LptE/RlpB
MTPDRMSLIPSARGPRPAVWLLLFAGLLGGCGFQPRGQAIDAGVLPSPIYVSGISPFSPLGRALWRELRVAGVERAGSATESAAHLRIHHWNQDSRVLSVDNRNKAIEYELEEAARFSLHAGDGRELLAEQQVRVIRILFRPRDAILGSDREGELLRMDMRDELAVRILRRLASSD